MACAVGPEPRLQASRKRSLKALFASLFLPRVGLGEGVRFLYTVFFLDINMESQIHRMFCKYYIYIYALCITAENVT